MIFPPKYKFFIPCEFTISLLVLYNINANKSTTIVAFNCYFIDFYNAIKNQLDKDYSKVYNSDMMS